MKHPICSRAFPFSFPCEREYHCKRACFCFVIVMFDSFICPRCLPLSFFLSSVILLNPFKALCFPQKLLLLRADHWGAWGYSRLAEKPYEKFHCGFYTVYTSMFKFGNMISFVDISVNSEYPGLSALQNGTVIKSWSDLGLKCTHSKTLFLGDSSFVRIFFIFMSLWLSLCFFCWAIRWWWASQCAA